MKNQRKTRWDRAVRLAQEQTQRWRKLLAGRPPTPQLGDLLVPPLAADELIAWVIVLFHPENPLLSYLVPADGHPLIGTADLAIPPDSPAGPLTLRCGLGVWAFPEDFGPEARLMFVDKVYLERAQTVLAELVRGTLRPSAAQMECEADPEYRDWYTRLTRLAGALQAWTDRNGPIISISALSLDHQPGDSISAAAGSTGLLGKIMGALHAADSTGPFTWSTAEGDLLLTTSERGVQFQWPSPLPPPRLRVRRPSGRYGKVTWTPAEQGLTTQRLQWVDGQVEAAVGETEVERLRIRP